MTEKDLAQVLNWLQDIIEDEPVGAYEGTYDYRDAKMARLVLQYLNAQMDGEQN
jgi:hypothetical protein